MKISAKQLSISLMIWASSYSDFAVADILSFDGTTTSVFAQSSNSLSHVDVTEWSGQVGWYNSATKTIDRKYWDNSQPRQNLVTGIENVADIAIGHTNYAYWIDSATKSILVSNGSSISTFAAGLSDPSRIQWDAWSGYVSWLDGDAIQRKYWDGNSPAETIVSGLTNVTEYATGHTSYAYWIDNQTNAIKQWNGSSILDFVVGLNDPQLIQWNSWTGYVTWFDSGTGSFQRKFWDGSSGVETVLSITGSISSFDAGPMNYIYWVPTAPIPEPETYAMLLAGLGLLGVVARRRKQKLNA